MAVASVLGFRASATPDRIAKYVELDESVKNLLKSAIDVRQRAYVPYSKFKVGAAFLTKSGVIFTGCNVESAAFTPTSCAERTAISKAVSEGCREFVAGAVVAHQNSGEMTTPCGVCRQFIMEFAQADDIPMYITNDSNNGADKADDDLVLCTSAYNLLPNSFRTYK